MAALEELDRASLNGARPGATCDSFDGLTPRMVVTPQDTAEVAAVLRVAAPHGLSIVARGAGTKLDWGNPPASADLLLDLSLMAGVTEHVSDDLVARVRAGTTLENLSKVLALKGQRFPVDEVVPGSTVGGVVATGLSGPSRYTHGAVRDLVLGITMVRADGVVARAGSKVVKNVAGYDLPKLLSGSYGTLGILTELIVKLKPMPSAQRFIVAPLPTTHDLAASLSALLVSQAALTAVELERRLPNGPVQLSVLVEGRPRPVDERAAEIAALLGNCEVSTSPPANWGRLPGEVTLKLTAVLSAVAELVECSSELAEKHGLAANLSGSAGCGVFFMGLEGTLPAAPIAALLADLRQACHRFGGHATVLRAPAPLKSSLDIWGPIPGLGLMRNVKQNFDPGQKLAPGRFVGGI
ncbi:MAG TPA: FAD-binding oxidoreductase [Acidimicrobiales bacterium]|nr:FAD-binding oxidoreductase [Acidimicrobiales bacterium]